MIEPDCVADLAAKSAAEIVDIQVAVEDGQRW